MRNAILAIAMLFGASTVTPKWDVEAVSYEIPAPMPCNQSLHGNGVITTTACITGPETRWTCADKARVLVSSEDGKRHCLNIASWQQP